MGSRDDIEDTKSLGNHCVTRGRSMDMANGEAFPQ
jgi:hypothetical protein